MAESAYATRFRLVVLEGLDVYIIKIPCNSKIFNGMSGANLGRIVIDTAPQKSSYLTADPYVKPNCITVSA